MEELAWADDLSVGIEQVDREHQDLFRVYGDLLAAVRAGVSSSRLYMILYNLTTHAEAHFKSEEIHMMAVAYPGFERHREIHVHLLRQVGVLTLEYGDATAELSSRILEALRPWLLDHITTEDRAFGLWVRSI